MILLKKHSIYSKYAHAFKKNKCSWYFDIIAFFSKKFLGYILFILRLLMRQQMFTMYLSHYIFVRKYWRILKANKHYQDFGYDCPYHTPIKKRATFLKLFYSVFPIAWQGLYRDSVPLLTHNTWTHLKVTMQPFCVIEL